jgi:uncharacterized membrane protein
MAGGSQGIMSAMGVRDVGRYLLAGILLFAGIGHFRSTAEFLAQVPGWMPAPEVVVYVSGVVEILLALALVLLRRQRVLVGWIVAAFFVLIFPGNVSQFLTSTSAFGLDTDGARFIRLLFQPALVVLALWSTGAWRAWRSRRSAAGSSLTSDS